MDKLQIELKKGKYFNRGDVYSVEFEYANEEQQKKMYDLFENVFFPSYGAFSRRATEGKGYIRPYLVDKNGNVTTEHTGIIGGTAIPDDLLVEFIRIFVEDVGAIVKVGNKKLENKFYYEQFDKMLSYLNLNEKFEKGVEGMPKRVVFTKSIKDEQLIDGQIDVGTVMDLNEYDFNSFCRRHLGCFSVVEMSRQDWIDLATENFESNYDKLNKLIAISEAMNLGVEVNKLVYAYKENPDVYISDLVSSDLARLYKKSVDYKELVEEFEKQVGDSLSPDKGRTL